MRPKCVSSGNTVWQASHDRPVWRAKLGTARADGVIKKMPAVTAPIRIAVRCAMELRSRRRARRKYISHGYISLRAIVDSLFSAMNTSYVVIFFLTILAMPHRDPREQRISEM